MAGGRARLQSHVSLWYLAPFSVGGRHYRDLSHCRMVRQHLFHFDGGNILAARNDDVFSTVAQLDVALRMHDG